MVDPADDADQRRADAERTRIAEQLLAVIFGLRADNREGGQAWALSIGTTALARAILGSVGPQGDAEPLLAIAAEQVRTIVMDAQRDFIRERLTAGPRRVR